MHNDKIPKIRGSRPQNLPHNQTEEIQRLSATYLVRRNQAIHLKSQAAEVELAVRRNELVERRLVELQATWLLTNMRQKLLNLGTNAHRFLNLRDINEIKSILREIGLNVLNEVRDLPKCATKDWLKEAKDAEQEKDA